MGRRGIAHTPEVRAHWRERRGLEVLMRVGVVAAVVMTVVPAVSFAQRASVADSMLTLNRSGHWAEAVALARQDLVTRGEPDPEGTCPVRGGLVYALTRLHEVQPARAALADYDRICATTVSARPFADAIAGLRKELTASKEQQ
ncbi:MAG: hypothetical protein ABJE47_10440 [bacterium]